MIKNIETQTIHCVGPDKELRRRGKGRYNRPAYRNAECVTACGQITNTWLWWHVNEPVTCRRCLRGTS